MAPDSSAKSRFSRVVAIARCWRPDDRGACLVAYALLLVWCAPFFYPLQARGPLGSDWEFFLAYFEAFRKSVLNYGQFPGFNPWNCLGSPLWANTQIGPVSHYGLLVLIFGTLVGTKLGVALSTLLSFETGRALGRHLFQTPTAPVIAGLLYAINAGLAAQLTRGQLCFGAYFLAPLLVLFCLQLPRRPWSGALAGVCAGAMVHYGVHYYVLYVLTLCGLLAMVRGLRAGAALATLRFGVLFGLSFLAVGGSRLLPLLSLQAAHPRNVHVDLAWPLDLLGRSFFTPALGPEAIWLYAGTWAFPIGASECLAYVGIATLLLALLSLRWGLRFYHVGAVLAAWLMLGNTEVWHLSRWLNAIPPFESAWLVFRWRLVLLACLAFAAARSVDRLLAQDLRPQAGRPSARLRSVMRIAVWAAPVEIFLLLLPSWYQLTMTDSALAMPRAALGLPDTAAMISARQVRAHDPDARLLFATTQSNIGTKFGYEPIFGYGPVDSIRLYHGHPEYKGELSLWAHRPEDRQAVPIDLWSPNRIVASALPPGALLEVNLNPGWGWTSNGQPLFENLPHFALRERFLVKVPPSGQVDLRYLPPGLIAGAALSLASGLALLAWWWLERRRIGKVAIR